MLQPSPNSLKDCPLARRAGLFFHEGLGTSLHVCKVNADLISSLFPPTKAWTLKEGCPQQNEYDLCPCAWRQTFASLRVRNRDWQVARNQRAIQKSSQPNRQRKSSCVRNKMGIPCNVQMAALYRVPFLALGLKGTQGNPTILGCSLWPPL